MSAETGLRSSNRAVSDLTVDSSLVDWTRSNQGLSFPRVSMHILSIYFHSLFDESNQSENRSRMIYSINNYIFGLFTNYSEFSIGVSDFVVLVCKMTDCCWLFFFLFEVTVPTITATFTLVPDSATSAMSTPCSCAMKPRMENIAKPDTKLVALFRPPSSKQSLCHTYVMELVN